MPRKSIAFSFLTLVILVCCASDAHAQLNSLRPIRRGGQFLGLGWGHGIHTRNPLSVSNYFQPYGPRNTPSQYSYGYSDSGSFGYPGTHPTYPGPTHFMAPQAQEPTILRDSKPDTAPASPSPPQTPDFSWHSNQIQRSPIAASQSASSNVWNNYRSEVQKRDTKRQRQSISTQRVSGPNQFKSRAQPQSSAQSNDFELPELSPSRDW